MNKDVRLHVERFDQELESYRLFAIQNKDLLKKDPWLDSQITYWMQSTRFLVAELEIWNQADNQIKCAEMISRTRKALDRLLRLIEQLKNMK